MQAFTFQRHLRFPKASSTQTEFQENAFEKHSVAFGSNDIQSKGLQNAHVARVLHHWQFTSHWRNNSSYSCLRDTITFDDQILGNFMWFSLVLLKFLAPRLNSRVFMGIEIFYLQWLLSGGVSLARKFYSRPRQLHFDGCDILNTCT